MEYLDALHDDEVNDIDEGVEGVGDAPVERRRARGGTTSPLRGD